MKYLVVDDSKLARKMTIKNLKELISEKCDIIEASNGQEAIDLYEQNNISMCFMDLTMPIVDGFEATKQINAKHKDAKIIIVSADIQEQAMTRAKENGAIGFIKKPINKNNLETMLKSLELI